MNPDQNRPDFSSPLKSGVKTSPLGPEGIFKQEEPREETRGAAAMASEFLENMKEKVTCAICLELLTEPLSLNCGHSFCQACITDNKKPEIGPGGESSCPVCGVRYSFGSLWLNQHLANIVERVKEVKLSPEEGQMKDLCLSHGERLQLFCKEDRKAICQFCEWSQEHRGHQIFLMEEVVKEYQEKLKTTLDRLRKEHREAEKLGTDIRKERTSWKNQIQTEKQRIQTEFNQLRSILDSEEQRELQKLEEEETKTLHDLAEAENELVQQSQLLEELISDLECRSEWSALELLQDTSGIMKWCVWVTRSCVFMKKGARCGH
ncbi:unnamed protein product [Pipistrellus nathusii]|uniref:Uncharacterized protein n=1 Tax=Pipistrellus nathusii TaxID=59473 RepID=A0ABP0AF10_PIPNA